MSNPFDDETTLDLEYDNVVSLADHAEYDCAMEHSEDAFHPDELPYREDFASDWIDDSEDEEEATSIYEPGDEPVDYNTAATREDLDALGIFLTREQESLIERISNLIRAFARSGDDS